MPLEPLLYRGTSLNKTPTSLGLLKDPWHKAYERVLEGCVFCQRSTFVYQAACILKFTIENQRFVAFACVAVVSRPKGSF